MSHEYLLEVISDVAGDESVWIRCERQPAETNHNMIAPMNRPAAKDVINISYDALALQGQHDILTYQATYTTGVKFHHVLNLVYTIHRVASRYGICSYNCRWFCKTTIVVLEPFGKDVSPSQSHVKWRKYILHRLVRHTRKASAQIEQEFRTKWVIEGDTIDGEGINGLDYRARALAIITW